MEYRFIFTPTLADYRQAHVFLQRRVLGKWWWLNLILSIFLGFLLVAPFLFLVSLSSRYIPADYHLYPLFAEIALLGAIAVYVGYHKIICKYVQRQTYVANGYMLEPRETVADEKGIRFIGKLSTGTLDWARAQAIEECANSLYFIVDPGMAFFVPKRAFADTAQLEKFRADIKAWHARP